MVHGLDTDVACWICNVAGVLTGFTIFFYIAISRLSRIRESFAILELVHPGLAVNVVGTLGLKQCLK